MIRREKGEYLAECNECGTEIYGGALDEFRLFLTHIRKEGWTDTKDEDGEYQHICPDCKRSRRYT